MGLVEENDGRRWSIASLLIRSNGVSRGILQISLLVEWFRIWWYLDTLWLCQNSYGKIHHFSWENPLFLWPFSIVMLVYQRVIPSLSFPNGFLWSRICEKNRPSQLHPSDQWLVPWGILITCFQDPGLGTKRGDGPSDLRCTFRQSNFGFTEHLFESFG